MSITAPNAPVAVGSASTVPSRAVRRVVGPLLVAVLVILAGIAALMLNSSQDAAPTVVEPYIREWTRQEALDNLARIDSYGSGGSGSTTTQVSQGVPTNVQ